MFWIKFDDIRKIIEAMTNFDVYLRFFCGDEISENEVELLKSHEFTEVIHKSSAINVRTFYCCM